MCIRLTYIWTPVEHDITTGGWWGIQRHNAVPNQHKPINKNAVSACIMLAQMVTLSEMA